MNIKKPVLPPSPVPDLSPIAREVPQREWLLRCWDGDELAVCGVGVSAGTIEITDARDRTAFTLSGSHIAAYRDALDAAIALAQADLRDAERRRAAHSVSDQSPITGGAVRSSVPNTASGSGSCK